MDAGMEPAELPVTLSFQGLFTGEHGTIFVSVFEKLARSEKILGQQGTSFPRLRPVIQPAPTPWASLLVAALGPEAIEAIGFVLLFATPSPHPHCPQC